MDANAISGDTRYVNYEGKFYCSVDGCGFSKGMGKSFKRKMLVIQHYLNSHSEKKYKCPKCSKAYSIDWQLKYHTKTCGIDWTCLTCNKTYKERLSLITHCKRHFHLAPESAKVRKKKDSFQNSNTINYNIIVVPVIFTNQTADPKNYTNNRPILPKSIAPHKNQDNLPREIAVSKHLGQSRLEHIAAAEGVNPNIATTKCQLKSQTATQTEKTSHKTRASRGAQCPPVRVIRRKVNRTDAFECAETQTLESTLADSANLHLVKSSKSTSTAITPPQKATKATVAVSTCNTSYLDIENDVDTHSTSSALIKASNPFLSQETTICSSMTPKHVNVPVQCDLSERSVQTDNPRLLFALNNIETQTSAEFTGQLLDFDVDEDLLFNDMELNDIETQTIWNNDETTQTEDEPNNFKGLDVLEVVDFFNRRESYCFNHAPTTGVETQTENVSQF